MSPDAPRRFAVVTDSTADIPAEMLSAHDITAVPLSVTIAGDTMSDGVLSQEEFFARMKATPQLPTTSQPPTGLFADAFERALETAESVVCVTISNKLSGTVESARQAAEQFAGRVHVFDSLNLSWGLGFQVMDAARSAAEGLTATAAIERLEDVRTRVRQIVALDGLENLRKGGRIGAVSAFLGSVLDVKVLLMVDPEGVLAPIARVRGEKAALAKTLDTVAEQMGDAVRGRFAVGYALYEERAHRLAEEIARRWDVAEMVVYPTGTVIATHTGTGWGVAVLPEP